MMEPEWLKYLDPQRRDTLREEVPMKSLGCSLVIKGYDTVNPQVELLIQIIKEIKKL